jgi:hypothetical protein
MEELCLADHADITRAGVERLNDYWELAKIADS